jgi:HK97 family phage portal protein
MSGLGTFLRSWLVDDPRVARSLASGQRGFIGGSELGVFAGVGEYQPAEYVTYVATSNAVYACINARTKALSSLPIKLYSKRRDADGKRKEITTGPARDLLDSINPRWTFQRWLDMTEQSLCVWGESFTFYTMKGSKPVEMWWARADRVEVHTHSTDYISHFTLHHGDGKFTRFEPNETLWLRFPNVGNEFRGLSPLGAARLAADTSSAAGKSNYNLFRNGIQLNTLITPKEGTNFSTEQMDSLADRFDKRFKGVDKAHRVGILQFDANVRQLSMTPKDAQFVDMMKLSLEDIARAYAVPLDKLGGQRTYANVDAAEKAFWADCIIPEARFIAAEITEQLLSLFGGDMVAEFDDSDIDALHEAETAKWERESGQLDRGVLKINEWRKEKGLPTVPWGDVVWLDSSRIPIDSPEKPVAAIPPALAPTVADPEDPTPPEDDPARSRSLVRTIEYGSPEHRSLWERKIADQEPWERRIGTETARLMADQQQSILARLRQRGKREAEDVLLDPFDLPRWIRTFRVTMRPIIAGVVNDAGELARDELALDFAFDVQDPNVLRAIETQVQRFAESVNQTTWDLLTGELAEGVADGESIDQLAERIQRVMGDRIRSSKETIARTETTVAANAGTMASWKQSGVVTQKRWLAALDDRTRESHIAAHGQVVALDDNFRVGSGSGPTPGQIGRASEDIGCRCSMVAVLDVETNV